MSVHPASFRDPAGRIHQWDGRIFRSVSAGAEADFAFARGNETLQRLIDEGAIVDCWDSPAPPHRLGLPETATLIEHPVLPFVSHPYEWPFSLLKKAALRHLDVQLALLAEDICLSDASAYNIQFVGVRPVFIDFLSFKKYEEGAYWTAHRQFCEQFLNPLLMTALIGVPYHEWYRGALEGVPATALARLLPLRKCVSLKLAAHVLLPARVQTASGGAATEKAQKAAARAFPKTAYIGLLQQLRGWIADLQPLGARKTVWSAYADDNSYSDAEAQAKKAAIAAFAARFKPRQLWDFGCNSGVYAETALANGAQSVIGFDADHGALDGAAERAEARNLNFLPLYQDAANPTPGQGWRHGERAALDGRAGSADAAMALAFVHHLAIGRNIPLQDVADWFVSLAPRGVIEFVPKNDPMVQQLLAFREDIFPDYTLEAFLAHLQRSAKILETETVTETGRTLITFGDARD